MKSLLDLPSEIVQDIISFCNHSSLVALDLVCTQFIERLTDNQWRKLAMDRYGNMMRGTGRQCFRAGMALTKPPVYIKLEKPLGSQSLYSSKIMAAAAAVDTNSISNNSMATNEYMCFFGDYQMCGSNKIICSTSEATKANNAWGMPPHSIHVRDARDLSTITHLGTAVPAGTRGCHATSVPFRIAIWGENDALVCVQDDGITTIHDGNRQQQIDLGAGEFGSSYFYHGSPDDDLRMIANDQFIVMTHQGKLSIYMESKNRLLKRRYQKIIREKGGAKHSAVITEPNEQQQPSQEQQGQEQQQEQQVGELCNEYEDEREIYGLAWTMYENVFAFSAERGEICLWQIQKTGRATEMKNFTTQEDNYFGSLAVSDKYVVGCLCFTNNIIVLNQTTGEQLHNLVDTVLEEFDVETGYPYSISLQISGDFLISNSMEGVAMCVWDLRSGILLAKHTHAFQAAHAEIRTDFPDVTSMVRCEAFDFHAYLMVDHTGEQYFWGFPEAAEDEEILRYIQQRETVISKIKARFEEGVDGLDEDEVTERTDEDSEEERLIMSVLKNTVDSHDDETSGFESETD